MRISITLIAVVLALLVVVMDYQLELGIVSFLSDFFVVLVALVFLFGAAGVKFKV